MIKFGIRKLISWMLVAAVVLFTFCSQGVWAQGQGGNPTSVLETSAANCDLGEVVIGDGEGNAVCFPLFSRCPCDFLSSIKTTFSLKAGTQLNCTSTHDAFNNSLYRIEDCSSGFGFEVEYQSGVDEWFCRTNSLLAVDQQGLVIQFELDDCLADGQAVAAALNFDCEPPEFEPLP